MKSYYNHLVRNHTLEGMTLLQKLFDSICKINCLNEEIESLYHQASVKLEISDSVSFVLYMTYINKGKCLLYDIYKSSGISKQTINSAIRKLENEDIVYLEKYNGKSKIVFLTEKGKDYANQTAKKLYKAEFDTFKDWDEEEMGLYLKLMEKHRNSFKKQIEKL